MDDFIDEISFYGLSARIKRLSDTLHREAREINSYLGFDIEPNWHLIFLSLKNESLTVTEIAKQLQFSHPAVIKIINKMKAKGYIESVLDENDSRKNILSLTTKSLKLLPEFEKGWKNIQSILEECSEENFIENIKYFESSFKKESLVERYKKLNKTPIINK
jgi:DNA-binding MarR family transcriptional regulator